MMKLQKYTIIMLAAGLGLGGCHRARIPETQWSDDNYISLMETGTDMVDADRIPSAIPLYQQALSRAMQANERHAIEISAYNLAVAQLKNKEPQASLETVRKAKISLHQHGIPVSPFLALVEGAVLNSQGKWEESQKAIAPCLTDKNPSIKKQAFYIHALNSASLRQGDILGKDIKELSSFANKGTIETENQEELEIRNDLLKGRYPQADKKAENLVQKRRINHEYSSMRDALSLEAEALDHLNKPEKAHALRMQVLSSEAASLP